VDDLIGTVLNHGIGIPLGAGERVDPREWAGGLGGVHVGSLHLNGPNIWTIPHTRRTDEKKVWGLLVKKAPTQVNKSFLILVQELQAA
jgi:hypothetical protein